MLTKQEIYLGDCLAGMRELSEKSVDLIVTDPPYEIKSLSPFLVEMMRLLKPSGSVYVFGDKNMIADHWFSQITMENKDLLVWHYKNSPKIHGRWRMSMQAIVYGYASDSVFHEDEARVEYLPATKKLNGRTLVDSRNQNLMTPAKVLFLEM